jgi:hypothetical protein
MSIADARATICAALTEALEGTKWYPKRPSGLRPDTGWVVLTGLTSENSTFAELQAGFNALLVLGSSEPAATDRMDDLILLFHEAVAGFGYNISVAPQPVTVDDNVLYTLVATFQMTVSTEVE